MARRRGSNASRALLGLTRAERRISGLSLWMAKLRERGLRDGFFGGSRPWMAVGVVTWAGRFIWLAVRHRPEVVYTTRLKKGESITVVEHPAGWRPSR
jgi:hypothetical protein